MKSFSFTTDFNFIVIIEDSFLFCCFYKMTGSQIHFSYQLYQDDAIAIVVIWDMRCGPRVGGPWPPLRRRFALIKQ